MSNEVKIDEKQRRIYYQDIVYHVCNWIDRRLGRKAGNTTICGTAESPSTGVQDGLREVAIKQCHLTLDEAQQEYDDATPVSISGEQLQQYVDIAMTDQKIEACPWCVSITFSIDEWDEERFFVRCDDCHACGPAKRDSYFAISEWNRIARAVAQRDVAVKALKFYTCEDCNDGKECVGKWENDGYGNVARQALKEINDEA